MVHCDNIKIKITKTPNNTVIYSSIRKYHTNVIKPLHKHKLIPSPDILSTMDIETMEYGNRQIPVCITTAYNVNQSKIFLINPNIEKDLAIDNL
jgi:hypothetical protein